MYKSLSTTTLLLMLVICCHGQQVQPVPKKLHIGNYVLSGSLVFLAGAADGLNQALSFHYDAVKSRFPGMNDHFWAPSVSWCNKYKNGDPQQGRAFPGSTTWLAFTTDGYHMTRFAEHLLLSGAIAVKIGGFSKMKWWGYLLQGAAYWLVNRAGFAVVYNRF